ncbi:MAG: hypothetical protein WBD46_16275, partial [Acidobacteriaceae bacterium]
EMEETRVYEVEDARAFLTAAGVDVDAMAAQGKFLSAFVRAVKPTAACCGPACCGGTVTIGGRG